MLPKKAAEHIDKKALEFLQKLETKPKVRSEKTTREKSSIDHRPTVHLKNEDIENLTGGTIDQEGNPMSFYFIYNNKEVGLSGNSYEEFFKFLKNLSERKELRQLVSSRKLNEIFINWFKKSYQKEEHTKASEHIFHEIKNSIHRYIVRFPIQHISISENFWVGKVHFSFLKGEDFDTIDEHYQRIHGKVKQNPFTDLRKHFQGHVTADVIIRAEHEKAIEMGLTEVKKSLAVLRYFSPSALNSKSYSLFCLHQLNYLPSYHIFSFKNNEQLPDYTIQPKIRAPFFWSIDKKEKNRISNDGMYHFDRLLKENNLSEFDEILINSLFLFEKALLAEEQQEKLVYLITCLETLLLRDSGEPIKKSIGQRLSFLISDNKDERKKIIDIISEAHRDRSSFIHHGQKIKVKDEVMQYTQLGLWITISKMTMKRKKFNTKMEFINFIDDEILSGNLRF